MNIAFMRVFTARKDHGTCQGFSDFHKKCDEPILPGQRYLRIVIPAWQDYEGDVNEDGRPIAILREESERRFTTIRLHEHCTLGSEGEMY